MSDQKLEAPKGSYKIIRHVSYLDGKSDTTERDATPEECALFDQRDYFVKKVEELEYQFRESNRDCKDLLGQLKAAEKVIKAARLSIGICTYAEGERAETLADALKSYDNTLPTPSVSTEGDES